MGGGQCGQGPFNDRTFSNCSVLKRDTRLLFVIVGHATTVMYRIVQPNARPAISGFLLPSKASVGNTSNMLKVASFIATSSEHLIMFRNITVPVRNLRSDW